MANNRLWAVCKKDNSAHVVLKYYPGEWYHVNCDNSDDWFRHHDHAADSQGTGSTIEFVKECDEDKVEFYDFRHIEGNPKIYLKGNNLPDDVKELLK